MKELRLGPRSGGPSACLFIRWVLWVLWLCVSPVLEGGRGEDDCAGVPAALEEGVGSCSLGEGDAFGDDRLDPSGGEGVEEVGEGSAVPVGVGRGVRVHGWAGRHVLAVRDQPEHEGHGHAQRPEPEALFRRGGRAEPYESSAPAKGLVGAPEVPGPSDRVDHGVDAVAGEGADTVDEVFGVVVDGRGPRDRTSS